MEKELENDEKRPRRSAIDTKKFEESCKRQSVEEKSRLIYAWCTKMIGIWEKDILEGGRPENYLKTPEGKMELGTLQ